MEVRETLKKLIVLNAIHGGSATKLTGIRDASSVFSGPIQIDPVENSIAFPPQDFPKFLSKGKFFRITEGGGTDQKKLFKVASVVGNRVLVEDIFPDSLVGSYFGNAVVDARLWVVIDDESIAKEASDGSTMFNVNYTKKLCEENIDDPSCLAGNFVEHYHGEDETNKCDDRYDVKEEYKEVLEEPFLLGQEFRGGANMGTRLLTQQPREFLITVRDKLQIPNVACLPIIEVWEHTFDNPKIHLLGVHRLATMTLTKMNLKKKSCRIEPVSVCLEDGLLTIDFGKPINGQVVLRGANNVCKC